MLFNALVQSINPRKLKKMKALHLITLLAGLVVATSARAQDFTGGFAIGGDGSYSSTTLNLGSFAISQGGTGTFALVSGLVPIDNGSISGLSGTSTLTLSAPLPSFELSAATAPASIYEFEVTSVTPETTAGIYQGTAELVDTGDNLATTPATFTLSFSGPDSYSFSADVVPEPSIWSLSLVALGGMFFLRRRSLRV
jgi:hypothetical protein